MVTSRVATIDVVADGIDRVTLGNGTVLDIHRPSLALEPRCSVVVGVHPVPAAPDAPYAVQAVVYDRVGDTVYASAGGLLHRLPGVDAAVGDRVLVTISRRNKRKL